MHAPLKRLIRSAPGIGRVARCVGGRTYSFPFPGSQDYWEQRYSAGGNSGAGSYERLAEFKAEVLNGFVADNAIRSVVEFGCGDGNQLRLLSLPQYLGLDVSPTAIARCRRVFESDPNKAFKLMSEYRGEQAELALSLDVIYHLVEDHVFESYMDQLFESAHRYVIVYSSDIDRDQAAGSPHVRHRCFTPWVAQNRRDWKLLKRVPNPYPGTADAKGESFADFFLYRRAQPAP